MDKVFFINSGAEANEGAIKLARKYGAKYKNGCLLYTSLNRATTSIRGALDGEIPVEELTALEKSYYNTCKSYLNEALVVSLALD